MQLDISRKIMEILDDNAQQVPEGFYLEVCNQLKKLHGVASGVPQDELVRRELAVRRSRNRLERQAAELNTLKEQVNKSVRDYNKCMEKFKEKKRKLEDRLQVRDDILKGREKLMDDFEDNITLAQLQRQLILSE
jgi:predicted HicB family RNase H-like nuclease